MLIGYGRVLAAHLGESRVVVDRDDGRREPDGMRLASGRSKWRSFILSITRPSYLYWIYSQSYLLRNAYCIIVACCNVRCMLSFLVVQFMFYIKVV